MFMGVGGSPLPRFWRYWGRKALKRGYPMPMDAQPVQVLVGYYTLGRRLLTVPNESCVEADFLGGEKGVDALGRKPLKVVLHGFTFGEDLVSNDFGVSPNLVQYIFGEPGLFAVSVRNAVYGCNRF
jgi:hypothetical protein